MRAKFPIQLAKELIILSAYSEAIDLLRPEAEKGDPDAQFLYGFLHFLNPDLSSSDALDLIRRAVQQGHAGAYYALATIHDFDAEYQFEMPHTEQQWQYLRFAVQKEFIPAVVMMAKAYRDGIFAQKDIRRSQKLLKPFTRLRRRSVEYAEAYYEHAFLLLDQRGPGKKKRAERAWQYLLFASVFAYNSDLIAKVRHLMAERIRDPRYGIKREDALRTIQVMKSETKLGKSRPQWQFFLDDYCRRTLTYDLNFATFEEFVSFLFDHPLENEDQIWRENWKQFASIRMNYHRLMQHYTRLFRDPAFLLNDYTPQELNQGFWNIYMGVCDKDRSFNIGRVLMHPTVSFTEAETCLEAMYDLFANLFSLPNIHELSGSAAYMWWDWGFYSIHRFRDINLDVMRRVLELDSIDCKWAALHGLGHLNHPGKEQVIRDFLAANPDLPDFDDWYQYGMAAIEGKIM
jgi:hypothetical protein